MPALLVALTLTLAGAPADGPEPACRVRRPEALAVSADGRRLFVANRAAGTVSVVDLAARRVVAEVLAGRGLADLAVTPDGLRLVAADAAGDALVVLGVDGPTPEVLGRLAIVGEPRSVRVLPDGSAATVAARWARRLLVVGLGEGGPRLVRAVDLPFAPGPHAVVGGGARAVVADAFGGGLAVVDLRSGSVESARTLPAHNIAALEVSADGSRLHLIHQVLNRHAKTTADDLHWGSLLNNSLRTLELAEVLDPGRDVIPNGRLAHFDAFGAGAGDPSGLALLPDGRAAVALGGVGQVAVGPPPAPDRLRLPVGGRPSAVALTPDGATALVADAEADVVVAVDLARGEVAATISLGPRPAPVAVERGERLFRDARLSHEGWMSCASCHVDGHTNGLRADTLGDGSYGAPKRVPSLLGMAETAPFAWDGGVPDLEAQIRKSVATTMRGPGLSEGQVADLAAYLRGLPPPPSADALAGRADPAAIARGRAAFEARRCDRCHRPPAYTSPGTRDVGLVDERGQAAFNPPSLIGVGQRDAFFHDGRARSLDDVLGRFAHPDGEPVPGPERADILAFLRSL